MGYVGKVYLVVFTMTALIPLCQRDYNCVTVFFLIAVQYDTHEAKTKDLKAGVELDPAPQETLKKTKEGGDDEPSLILSIGDWNFLRIIYSGFVSCINVRKCLRMGL